METLSYANLKKVIAKYLRFYFNYRYVILFLKRYNKLTPIQLLRVSFNCLTKYAFNMLRHNALTGALITVQSKY